MESIEEILPGEPGYCQWGEQISVLRETVEDPGEAELSDGLTIHSAGSPENIRSADRSMTSRNMEKQKRVQRLIDKMREGWQTRTQRQPELEIMQQLARQMKEQQEANSDIDPTGGVATPRPGPSSYRMALGNAHGEKRRDEEKESQGSRELRTQRDPAEIETRGARRKLSLGRRAQLAAMILDSDDSPEGGPNLLRDSRGEQIRRRHQPPDAVEERVEKEIHRRVAQLLRPRDMKSAKRPLAREKIVETSDSEERAAKAKTRDPVPGSSKEATAGKKKNKKKTRRQVRREKWRNGSPSTGASQTTSPDGAQKESPPRNSARETNDPPRGAPSGEATWTEGPGEEIGRNWNISRKGWKVPIYDGRKQQRYVLELWKDRWRSLAREKGLKGNNAVWLMIDLLRGPVREKVLQRLGSIIRWMDDPEDVIKELEKIYDEENSIAEVKQRFHTRKQLRNENPTEYLWSLRGLHQEMDPHASNISRNIMVLERFLQGLQESDAITKVARLRISIAANRLDVQRENYLDLVALEVEAERNGARAHSLNSASQREIRIFPPSPVCLHCGDHNHQARGCRQGRSGGPPNQGGTRIPVHPGSNANTRGQANNTPASWNQLPPHLRPHVWRGDEPQRHRMIARQVEEITRRISRMGGEDSDSSEEGVLRQRRMDSD